jgi:hypothetical protein
MVYVLNVHTFDLIEPSYMTACWCSATTAEG